MEPENRLLYRELFFFQQANLWRNISCKCIVLDLQGDQLTPIRDERCRKLTKKKLSDNPNSDILARLVNDIGKGPDKLFPAKLKKLRFVHGPSSEGIVEFKKLLLRSRLHSSLSWPKEEGIFPLAKMLFHSRI
ncbi:hypothetical protein AAZX31_03G147300 [Glycine max]